MSRPVTPGHDVGTPQCPYCRHILIPRCTFYVDSTAFCWACSDTRDGPTILAIIRTQNHPQIAASWSDWHGLHYFVPKPGIPTNVSVHLLARILDGDDPANLLPLLEY